MDVHEKVTTDSAIFCSQNILGGRYLRTRAVKEVESRESNHVVPVKIVHDRRFGGILRLSL